MMRLQLDIRPTDRLVRFLQLAEEEARKFGHDYIAPEHVLLAIVQDGEGIAAGVLDGLGVSLKIRTAVRFILGAPLDDRERQLLDAREAVTKAKGSLKAARRLVEELQASP